MSNQPNPQKRNKKKSQEKQRWLRRRQYNNLRFSALSMLAIAASFLLILLFLLVFPRSKVSEIENRNLAKFPKFTLSGYFSGEFTSDVATWFDDTVPFRDSLKNLGYTFKNIFGFSTDDSITFINQDVVANDMNAATADGTEDAAATPDSTLEAAAEASPVPTEEADQKDFTAEDAEFDMSNGLLVVKQDGHWKCLSLFGGGDDTNYVNALTTLHEKLGDSVKIYSMPAPLASQFYTPANAASYSADQSSRFDEVAEELGSGITSINICPVLAKHTEEDIYLRTDHHWAPLGVLPCSQNLCRGCRCRLCRSVHL